jgi:hypothetical protein
MRRLIITAVLAAALGAAATACGDSASSNGTVSLPKASCGNAGTEEVNGGAPVFGSPAAPDREALSCFATAAVTCQAASLNVTVHGTDFADDDVYAISPGGAPGRCEVTDYGQSSSANFGGSTSPVTATRCQVAATATGATITCPSKLPILIPAGPQ